MRRGSFSGGERGLPLCVGQVVSPLGADGDFYAVESADEQGAELRVELVAFDRLIEGDAWQKRAQGAVCCGWVYEGFEIASEPVEIDVAQEAFRPREIRD